MALQLAPMEGSDLDDFMRVHRAAFVNGISPYLVSQTRTPENDAAMVARYRKAFHNPTARFMKVTDTSTGDVVACSKWSFFLTERSQQQVDEDTRLPDAPATATPAWFDLLSFLRENRREVWGTRPHIMLDILITDPTHHRRGAGAMMLQWGAEQADRAGLESYVESSVMGKPLYERFGYEPFKGMHFDLSKYGGQGFDTFTLMIRPPQRRS